MPAERVQFRVGPLVEAALQERAESDRSLSHIADRDLERYYVMLQKSLPTFNEGEAHLIVDALNGTLTHAPTAHWLWAGIDDAIRLEGLDRKWGVDGPALIKRLGNLTPFEALAVADAAERFWMAPNEEGRLVTVGLVKKPDSDVT